MLIADILNLELKWRVRARSNECAAFERCGITGCVRGAVVAGRFPVSRELAAELGALMAQLDMGEHCAHNSQHAQPLAHRFYPYRYRAGLTNDELRYTPLLSYLLALLPVPLPRFHFIHKMNEHLTRRFSFKNTACFPLHCS